MLNVNNSVDIYVWPSYKAITAVNYDSRCTVFLESYFMAVNAF